MSSPSPAGVERDVPSPFAPFTLRGPEVESVPLICDSPHSGTRYPADFGFALDFKLLRKGEDTDVQHLWQALPSVGATLMAAEFPRAYIDPNRELEDIDPGMLDAPWPGPLNPSEKTRLGIGLIWRDAGKNGLNPIYARKLTVAEVQQRIDHYHRPYHAQLNALVDEAHQRFGAVWHLNLHSMPANSYEALGIESAHPLADFVLGDRDGSTAARAFTDAVAQALRSEGFSVAINDPFKGVAVIARLGRPAERRHSLQVEVHRGLYMDEETRARSSNFKALQAALTRVSQQLARFVMTELDGVRV